MQHLQWFLQAQRASLQQGMALEFKSTEPFDPSRFHVHWVMHRLQCSILQPSVDCHSYMPTINLTSAVSEQQGTQQCSNTQVMASCALNVYIACRCRIRLPTSSTATGAGASSLAVRSRGPRRWVTLRKQAAHACTIIFRSSLDTHHFTTPQPSLLCHLPCRSFAIVDQSFVVSRCHRNRSAVVSRVLLRVDLKRFEACNTQPLPFASGKRSVSGRQGDRRWWRRGRRPQADEAGRHGNGQAAHHDAEPECKRRQQRRRQQRRQQRRRRWRLDAKQG